TPPHRTTPYPTLTNPQVLARSSPDDKYLLVTRLNGTALPRDRAAWEEQHPQLKWETDKDRALPGYWDEVWIRA
ncbi:unnamed protein product, partial [Laminaria digitata]